jgi:glyoxylase-like metal-dependent hydrolase (beta-lactamase superfamily II)
LIVLNQPLINSFKGAFFGVNLEKNHYFARFIAIISLVKGVSMEILSKAMGVFQTNCYIVRTTSGDIIIDPGYEATKWVVEHATSAIAILNTHGHFDHTWSNAALQDRLGIPLYTPKADVFMLRDDYFGYGAPDSTPDVVVEPDAIYRIGDESVKFLHFPGHTPGCSAIKIGNALFSGDFVFYDSIGRTDFPYSSPADMRRSIQKFLKLEENWTIYPGHGIKTTVEMEQKRITKWL